MSLLNYRLTTRIAAGFAVMVLLTPVLGGTSTWMLRQTGAEAQAQLADERVTGASSVAARGLTEPAA